MSTVSKPLSIDCMDRLTVISLAIMIVARR